MTYRKGGTVGDRRTGSDRRSGGDRGTGGDLGTRGARIKNILRLKVIRHNNTRMR